MIHSGDAYCVTGCKWGKARQSTGLASRLSQHTALGSGAHLRSSWSWASSEHTLQPTVRSTRSRGRYNLTMCSAVYLRNPLLHGLLTYYSFYRPRKDERLSRPSWLAYPHQSLPSCRPSVGQEKLASWDRRSTHCTTQPNPAVNEHK